MYFYLRFATLDDSRNVRISGHLQIPQSRLFPQRLLQESSLREGEPPLIARFVVIWVHYADKTKARFPSELPKVVATITGFLFVCRLGEEWGNREDSVEWNIHCL